MSHVACRGAPLLHQQDRTARFPRALALELAPDKVTVNSISPGPFATELNVADPPKPELNQQFHFENSPRPLG